MTRGEHEYKDMHARKIAEIGRIKACRHVKLFDLKLNPAPSHKKGPPTGNERRK